MRTFAIGMVVLTAIVGSALARSNPLAPPPDPVRTWNALALDTVRLKRASDVQAARLYAMINVAMYDAVNGIESRQGHHTGRTHALVPATVAPPQGSLYAAASAAAHAVLIKEFPDQATRYDLRLQSDLAALPSGGHTTASQAWGAHVGKQVHRQRANDGSNHDETQPAGAGPGQFPHAWSGVQFRNLAPFGTVDPSVYVGAGPPALTSNDYAIAFAEVKLVGNKVLDNQDLFDTYQYWSLGGGTTQPPGAWIQVALAVTTDQPLFLPEMAHLFALTSMAMSDTVAPTVMTKFLFRHWRPTTAIQQAADDQDRDPNWTPRAGSPGTSPEYWSGHSTFSAAAATVLAGFFCDDAGRDMEALGAHIRQPAPAPSASGGLGYQSGNQNVASVGAGTR
jgi:hypothetical protein